MPRTQSKSREVSACITLIDGPDPQEIMVGARLRFKGLHRQSLFTLTLDVTKVLEKKDNPPIKDGLAMLGELMNGREEIGDVFFEGRLMTVCQSDANGTGAWVQVIRSNLHGLWRKSHPTIVQLVPKGNGFIEVLK